MYERVVRDKPVVCGVSVRQRWFLLASALLAVGVGCGRPSATVETVRLSTTGGAALAYLPIHTAVPSGCVAKEGFELRIDETGGSTKSVQALVGGSVDVAACDYLTVLKVTNQGQSLKEFVLLQKIPGFVALASPAKSVKSLRDLKGRTVGVTAPGVAYHLLFNQILRRHGMLPEQVSFVGVGAGMSMALAVGRGVVDAGLVGPLGMSYLRRHHPATPILADTRTPESTQAALGIDEIAFFVLSAREEWLKAHPQTARKVASAMRCSLEWIQSHTPQEIRAALPPSGQSPDLQSDFEAIDVAKRALSPDGRMTAKAHATAVQLLLGQDAKVAKEPYTNEYLGQ